MPWIPTFPTASPSSSAASLLYRNGQLIGAVGVSGDGIDQDDIVTASGTVGLEAPVNIRSDQYFYSDARLPFAKFPRNPAL